MLQQARFPNAGLTFYDEHALGALIFLLQSGQSPFQLRALRLPPYYFLAAPNFLALFALRLEDGNRFTDALERYWRQLIESNALMSAFLRCLIRQNQRPF